MPDQSLRNAVPRSSHAIWTPDKDRPSPVDVIVSQNSGRLEWLLPIRHHRMSESPFTFYRGAAKLMALDLATTPVTGIDAQICGDAHLSNFGFYGAPDRSLVFDVNDFDETLPGPWEWDVKRLATSFAIAAANNGYGDDEGRALASEATAAYRAAMREMAGMGYLDVWYLRVDASDVWKAFKDDLTKRERKESKRALNKTRRRDSRHALGKMAELTPAGYRIISQPPLIVPLRDLEKGARPDTLRSDIHAAFESYLASVPDHLRVLLRRFQFVDLAVKVVGVGSVGTRCFVVLLEGKDSNDPLFLQVKEAASSVLEDHLTRSMYPNRGQRVVEGQRLMQAASDSFLGWTEADSSGHHYYWRQLKDMKGSLEVEDMDRLQLHRYAGICGRTLARAHARSTDVQKVAAYLGKGDAFDRAIGEFSVRYAAQNQLDFERFKSAVESGDIPAHS